MKDHIYFVRLFGPHYRLLTLVLPRFAAKIECSYTWVTNPSLNHSSSLRYETYVRTKESKTPNLTYLRHIKMLKSDNDKKTGYIPQALVSWLFCNINYYIDLDSAKIDGTRTMNVFSIISSL